MKRDFLYLAGFIVLLIAVIGFMLNVLDNRRKTDGERAKTAIDNVVEGCNGPVQVKLHYSKFSNYTEVTCDDTFHKSSK